MQSSLPVRRAADEFAGVSCEDDTPDPASMSRDTVNSTPSTGVPQSYPRIWRGSCYQIVPWAVRAANVV